MLLAVQMLETAHFLTWQKKIYRLLNASRDQLTINWSTGLTFQLQLNNFKFEKVCQAFTLGLFSQIQGVNMYDNFRRISFGFFLAVSATYQR